MTAPTITALPSAPNRTSPGSTFSADAAAFVAALSTLVGELNSLGSWLNSNALLAYEWGDGSAAAPSVHPASDDTLGMYFSENELGLAVAGAMRALLSSTAFQIDVPVTGDAVQSSASDATSGRLLKVGAFGLGDTLISTPDFDALTKTGFYVNSNAAAVGAPTAVSNWHVIHFHNADTVRTQIAFRPGDMRMRRYISSSWGSWSRIYDQGSVLSAVSQSGGVPTGGLLEYGSNGNGSYLRLADGTQICWKVLSGQGPINTVYGAGYSSASISFGALPASFAAAPGRVLSSFGSSAARSGVEGAGTPSTSDGGSCYLTRMSTSAATDFTVVAVFIGRWF